MDWSSCYKSGNKLPADVGLWDPYSARVYFLPVTPEFVVKVIEREKPDGIFAAWGGQTALNCAVKMYQAGVFEKYNVKVLGHSVFRKMKVNYESVESDV